MGRAHVLYGEAGCLEQGYLVGAGPPLLLARHDLPHLRVDVLLGDDPLLLGLREVPDHEGLGDEVHDELVALLDDAGHELPLRAGVSPYG